QRIGVQPQATRLSAATSSWAALPRTEGHRRRYEEHGEPLSYTCRVRDLPAEVTSVLESLLPAVLQALGARVVSIVLWGSSVLGDYRVGRSDIDLLVGLDGDPDAAILRSLQPVHDKLDRALPEWRGRIEAAYVGLPSLRSFRTTPHVIA